MPLIAELRIGNSNGEERREKEELIIKIRWDEEAKQIFKDKIEESLRLEEKGPVERTIEEKWEKIREKVKDALERKKKKKKKKTRI